MSDPRSKRKYGFRATPQLSANQMAEYIGSSTSSTRRRSIIRDARFPKTSVVAQYDRSREGLVNFLTDGTRSFRHIADALDVLAKREARPDATDWVKRDCRGSVEAMESFQRAYNRLPFRKFECRSVAGRLIPLQLGPTKISVAMDFTVHKPNSGGKDNVGGAIMLFSRGESSGKNRIERSKVIAGLIYTWCDKHLRTLGNPDPDLCLAVDVFGGVAYSPPGTFAKKLRNVSDACEDIAAIWPTIKPPEDYDGPDPD
jgi:hypothetical protein